MIVYYIFEKMNRKDASLRDEETVKMWTCGSPSKVPGG
jgi:hypothetical protein